MFKKGIRKLEALFASLIAIMAISFGIEYVISKPNQVCEREQEKEREMEERDSGRGRGGEGKEGVSTALRRRESCGNILNIKLKSDI